MLFSSKVRIRIRFSVWLVSCYVHVSVRLLVVIVTDRKKCVPSSLGDRTTAGGRTGPLQSSRRRRIRSNCRLFSPSPRCCFCRRKLKRQKSSSQRKRKTFDVEKKSGTTAKQEKNTKNLAMLLVYTRRLKLWELKPRYRLKTETKTRAIAKTRRNKNSNSTEWQY